ncbi:hypothetical protein ORI89_00205 [Sphingobacterium sp. UT-1RO-CII-1]|uniref:hypothetical protein n=1 Tax=Sphingobacterium sp. UT-1RO-CII-1 TaxID=2995225 RepID=UPI00227A9760|nr:hypothetical protein [Sphingobacterium sp. UT-1RO-CII-1]MCY4778052.1 hypothetical protein [Sphingobacterium sp. UT-1RO-CII-1]
MLYYWRMLQHFFVSNSRHGTHSPFVYKLADQVIYKKKEEIEGSVDLPTKFSKTYCFLLQDILAYLGVHELQRGREKQDAAALFFEHDELDVSKLKLAMKKKQIVIMDQPHKNNKVHTLWNHLVQDSSVTVSLDLFYFGLLLYREGQRKEHFLLRYPFWKY